MYPWDTPYRVWFDLNISFMVSSFKTGIFSVCELFSQNGVEERYKIYSNTNRVENLPVLPLTPPEEPVPVTASVKFVLLSNGYLHRLIQKKRLQNASRNRSIETKCHLVYWIWFTTLGDIDKTINCNLNFGIWKDKNLKRSIAKCPLNTKISEKAI